QAASPSARTASSGAWRSMGFIVVAGSFEAAAKLDAKLAEDDGGRAEAGDTGLQQVQADEGGQQQPPGREVMREQYAGEGHHSGEGKDGAVEVHGGSPK